MSDEISINGFDVSCLGEITWPQLTTISHLVEALVMHVTSQLILEMAESSAEKK